MNSKKEKEKETKEGEKKDKKRDNTNTLTKQDNTRHAHHNTNHYDPYMHNQHTNKSLQNNIHILNTPPTYKYITSKQHSCVQGPLLECFSQALPYHCTPPVCVPAVLGGLAVRRHNNKKIKN